jgi:hypothetical protein
MLVLVLSQRVHAMSTVVVPALQEKSFLLACPDLCAGMACCFSCMQDCMFAAKARKGSSSARSRGPSSKGLSSHKPASTKRSLPRFGLSEALAADSPLLAGLTCPAHNSGLDLSARGTIDKLMVRGCARLCLPAAHAHAQHSTCMAS